MRVFLDLWGVLLDSETMQREYGRVLARHLTGRFGGEESAWTAAHTAAWTEYVQGVEAADWSRDSWSATADRLDARFALGILERMGIEWRPEDPAGFSRELDLQVLSAVNARFPDARSAVERLRSAGHRVYVATQATESNARGALAGAQLLGSVDDIFTGTRQDSLKSRPAYWEKILRDLAAPPRECLLVDDRMDYLETAASSGVQAILLDREGVYEATAMPSFVRATLRNLAGLPHFVEVLEAEGKRTST